MAYEDDRVTVALLGLGTVGTGVARLLVEHPDRIARRAGRPLRWKWAAVRHLDKPRAVKLDGVKLTTDARAIFADPEVEVVIETMGGTDPALQFVLAALGSGKHVVTANKALLAEHGCEVFAQAKATRPGGRVRGKRRRRHSDRPGARLRAGGQPGSKPGRDRQRHLQLHPHQDEQRGAGLRRRPAPRPSSWATPRPTRRSTSTAPTPRTSWRSWRSSRSRPTPSWPTSRARASIGCSLPTSNTPASWATRSSCWRSRSSHRRDWSCGLPRLWSSRARRWRRCAGRTTRFAWWAMPSATRSSTAEAPARCRRPRPSSAT